MTPDEYSPLYFKAKKQYTQKCEEVKLRQELLKQQHESNMQSSKKDYKLEELDNRLKKLEDEEDCAINYYKKEIEKAEERCETNIRNCDTDIVKAEEKLREYIISKKNEISNVEEKLRSYKTSCMDNIERLKEKYDIKKNALELKKNVSNIPFDESNDMVLNKLKLELENLKGVSDRADINMATYEAQDRHNRIALQLDREFLQQQEQIRKDALKKDAKEQEELKLYNKIVEEAEKRDALQYAAAAKDRMLERQAEAVQENIKMYALKKELEKVWTPKQEQKYKKLSRDERLGFIDLELQAVLDHLN